MARALGICAGLVILFAVAVQLSMAASQTNTSDVPPTPSPTPSTAPKPTPTASPTPTPTPSPTSSVVVINVGAQWTNQANVTVALPYPSDDSGIVRLSNDGVHWSSPTAWAPTVPWDITDAGAGGTSPDGSKTVHVQWGDANHWSNVGSASITLDRTVPVLGADDALECHGGVAPSGWTWQPCIPNSQSESGHLDFSLDGGPWTSIDYGPTVAFDFRRLLWGGSWRLDDRQICWRLTDYAGNVSQPSCDTFDLDIPSYALDPRNSTYKWNVRFELPLPAVTGQPFTIRPIYPPDMPAMPSNSVCWWILRWGDEGKVLDTPNEDYGSVWIKRTWGSGACGEWTFTLPYTPGLTYEFSYQLFADGSDTSLAADVFLGENDQNLTDFRASVGTYERGIPHSTIGLAYLLPTQSEASVGQPMTYTLHGSDTLGWSVPKPGMYFAANVEICGHEIDPAPTQADSWTYTPDCQGAWDTGWWWQNLATHELLRADYDPPADKAAPVVTAPRALPSAGSQVGTTIHATISWTASDPVVHHVSTGVAQSQLQMSRNSGAWKNLTLASPTSTSVSVALSPTGTYRFRVRAYDAVGNKGAWSVGPVLKPRLLQQSVASLSGWSTVSASGFSGGSAAQTAVAGANATLTFSGQAISWIGSRGPGYGLAQIRIDGALVQTIDLGAASAIDKTVLFSRALAAGTHTIKVTVLGTYGRPSVTVDAFTVF